MQHNGLGTILLGQLTQAAEQAGVAVLSAEVLPENHRMLHVFRDSGFPLTIRTLPGVVLVELATSRSPDAGAFRIALPPTKPQRMTCRTFPVPGRDVLG
jgi:ribosomal protein S18 acetylase RimI-like enzyme